MSYGRQAGWKRAARVSEDLKHSHSLCRAEHLPLDGREAMGVEAGCQLGPGWQHDWPHSFLSLCHVGPEASEASSAIVLPPIR